MELPAEAGNSAGGLLRQGLTKGRDPEVPRHVVTSVWHLHFHPRKCGATKKLSSLSCKI